MELYKICLPPTGGLAPLYAARQFLYNSMHIYIFAYVKYGPVAATQDHPSHVARTPSARTPLG